MRLSREVEAEVAGEPGLGLRMALPARLWPRSPAPAPTHSALVLPRARTCIRKSCIPRFPRNSRRGAAFRNLRKRWRILPQQSGPGNKDKLPCSCPLLLLVAEGITPHLQQIAVLEYAALNVLPGALYRSGGAQLYARSSNLHHGMPRKNVRVFK